MTGQQQHFGGETPRWSYNEIRAILVTEYERSVRAQASATRKGRDAGGAIGATIAITDIAGKLGVIL